MPTVMVTFVQATFVLATFVHIRDISFVTDPILTKRLGQDFLQASTVVIDIFFPKFSLTEFFWDLKNFLDQKFCEPKIFRPNILFGILEPKFF